MTSQNASRDDFDRLMRQWMDADARVREPELAARDRARADAATRDGSGWLLPERWIPMQLTMRLQPVPRLVPVLLLLIALVLVGAALVIGLGPWKPLPSPFGPARNGLLAYDTNAAIFVCQRGRGRRPADSSASVPHAAAATLARWHEGRVLGRRFSGLAVRGQCRWQRRSKVSGDLWIGTDRPARWSPDSRSIAFSSESGPNVHDEQIYVVDVSPRPHDRMAITHSDTVRAFMPAWSPDGKWIAFIGVTSPTSGGKIWIVNPDGSELRALPTTAAIEDTQPEWAPSVAPLRLAYAQAAAIHEQQDIYVLDLSTGVETAISSDPANERWPTWSPDGTRLAWLVGHTPTQLRIAQMDHPASSLTLASDFMGHRLRGRRTERRSTQPTTPARRSSWSAVDGSAPNERFAHAGGQGLPAWQRLAP